MKEIIETKAAPAPIGPYSQAVKAGNTLYISGQISLDAITGELVQNSIQAETHQIMKNIEAILISSGYSFLNIVKVSIFLKDMSLFADVNDVYGSYFNSDFPARETVAVKGLPKDVNVEISVIAYKE